MTRDKIENEYVKVCEEIEEDGTQNRDTLIRDRRKLDFSVKMGRLGDQMAKCAGVVSSRDSVGPTADGQFL